MIGGRVIKSTALPSLHVDARMAAEDLSTVDASFDAVPVVLDAMRRGELVIVVDDEDRENEADLIMAGSLATAERLGFMIRHTSGIICASIPDTLARRLDLAPMIPNNQAPLATAFTVSIDHRKGMSTGIAPEERASTIRALSDETTTASDFVRPGHVFPLIARPGGILRRSGHTEAAVDLARMAGLPPVGVLAELVNEDGTPCRLTEAMDFAAQHGLKITSVAQLISHRSRHEKLIERVEEREVQTAAGPFTAIVYRNTIDGDRHLALVAGAPAPGEVVPVRIHTSSFVEDLFCAEVAERPRFLWKCLRYIRRNGSGVVVYLGATEGGMERGSTEPKHHATSADLYGRASARNRDSWKRVGIGAQILADLSIRRIELLCLASRHYPGLSGYDLEVVQTNFLSDP